MNATELRTLPAPIKQTCRDNPEMLREALVACAICRPIHLTLGEGPSGSNH